MTHLVTEGLGVEHGGGGEGAGLQRVGEGKAVGGDDSVDGQREARRPLQRQGGTCGRGRSMSGVCARGEW